MATVFYGVLIAKLSMIASRSQPSRYVRAVTTLRVPLRLSMNIRTTPMTVLSTLSITLSLILPYSSLP